MLTIALCMISVIAGFAFASAIGQPAEPYISLAELKAKLESGDPFEIDGIRINTISEYDMWVASRLVRKAKHWDNPWSSVQVDTTEP